MYATANSSLLYYVVNLDDFFLMVALACFGLGVVIILEVCLRLYLRFHPLRAMRNLFRRIKH